MTLENIAQALLRSMDFVNQAIKRWKEGELEDLALTSHNYKLSSEKRQNVITLIKGTPPNELEGFKFKEQLWTTSILQTVIKRKYGIEYKTEKSYYDLFKAAGFSFHKPKTKDFRQDPAKMKKFKGALKKSSKTTKIRLSW
jgi:transposase